MSIFTRILKNDVEFLLKVIQNAKYSLEDCECSVKQRISGHLLECRYNDTELGNEIEQAIALLEELRNNATR